MTDKGAGGGSIRCVQGVPADAAVSKNMRRVVVVEDNKINSRLFVDLLELNGMIAYPILDGEVAFDSILEIRPDIVIMDIQLQKTSGIDIIKRIKETPEVSNLPIIAVTAFASQQDEKQIMAVGCDAYMSKPISIEDFIELVNRYLYPRAARTDEQL